MASRQLRLFPSPQPLVERWGVEFFRELPQGPGVYWFARADGRLLYVGKARNLRKRLNSYRRIEGLPRRTTRLVNSIAFVRWEPCASEAVALEREAGLIRTYQPLFNRAGKGRGRRKWVWLRWGSERFEIGLAEDAPTDPTTVTWAGQPFGFGAPSLFGAWLRLMALTLDPRQSLLDLPRPLLRTPGPRNWSFQTHGADWSEPLAAFLEGSPESLLAILETPCSPAASLFEVAWRTADLENLKNGLGLLTR